MASLVKASSKLNRLTVGLFALCAALAFAREGRFPTAIEADVSEERLRRFFTREVDHYRVRKEVRDLVVFATHSMLKDPPFSRLDLVSCRSLLIHLERDLRAARPIPFDLLALVDEGLVLPGVDLDFEVMRGGPGAGARDDLHRLAGGELAVHPGGGNPDALLPAALPQAVELGSIEQLREDPWNLLAHDTGAVVGDRDAETRSLARRWRRRLRCRGSQSARCAARASRIAAPA